MGRKYELTIDTPAAVSAARDLFQLPVPAGTVIRLLGLIVSQTTEATDAQDEMLQIRVIRGHTSGAGALTPSGLDSQDSACTITDAAIDAAVASGGTPVTVLSDAFNVRSGYQLWWTPETAPIIRNADSRVVVRVSAPTDPVSFVGTLYFEEIG